jgi:hypothetical protein
MMSIKGIRRGRSCPRRKDWLRRITFMSFLKQSWIKRLNSKMM